MFSRILFIWLSLSSAAASAKCAGEWFSVEPAMGASLPAAPRLLVTLGGRLRELNAHIEFVAGPEQVDAVTVSTFDGYMQRQLFVKPARELRPGAWELRVTFAGEVRGPAPEPRRVGPWKVATLKTSGAPRFNGQPRLKETSWQEYGCGPGSSIDLVGVALDAPGFVEAAMTVNGKTTTAVFVATQDTLDLGHGMCSGSFNLAPGTHAAVVLTPIDLAGTRGVPSAPVEFIAPGPAAK